MRGKVRLSSYSSFLLSASVNMAGDSEWVDIVTDWYYFSGANFLGMSSTMGLPLNSFIAAASSGLTK